MHRRNIFWIIAVIVLIPASIIAWWLISPLFIVTTVEEDFPFSRNAEIPAGLSRSEVEKVLAGMAKVDQEMSETMPGAMAAAVRIKAGSLRDGDSFHKGSGRATIYRLADGSHVLRLEQLNVTNGPALHVLLARHPNPQAGGDVKNQGTIDLGKLKGNIGNQNYLVPAEVDVSALRSVVIYCKPFHVVFSVAPLQDSARQS